MVRRCLWYRNLVKEEALVHLGLLRQKQTNICDFRWWKYYILENLLMIIYGHFLERLQKRYENLQWLQQVFWLGLKPSTVTIKYIALPSVNWLADAAVAGGMRRPIYMIWDDNEMLTSPEKGREYWVIVRSGWW